MAGQNPDNPGFDAEFRAAIREAMEMGTPTVVADRPTFRIPGTAVHENVDAGGAPWDFADEPESATPDTFIRVRCAVEAVGAGGEDETAVGVFDTDVVRIYLFEDEWAQVSEFVTVQLGQSTYRRVKRLNPYALYGVQMEVIECEALDES